MASPVRQNDTLSRFTLWRRNCKQAVLEVANAGEPSQGLLEFARLLSGCASRDFSADEAGWILVVNGRGAPEEPDCRQALAEVFYDEMFDALRALGWLA